ncbi:MAG: RidA family protein [Rhodobacteraceae bacterium]|nr:RidA family protein [Paracoccaceae bacterium]
MTKGNSGAALGLAAGVFAAMLGGQFAMADELEIKRWNPPGLSEPAGYSQVVTVKGDHKEILLGGKAGLHPDGKIPPTLEEQVKLAFENIKLALAAEGAEPGDVVELQVYVVDLPKLDRQNNALYQGIRDFFPAGHKPVSMVIGVSALALPDLMFEMNVRAAVPLK